MPVTRVKNVWMVPQSMAVGAVAVVALMCVPQVRDMVDKVCDKVSATLGL